MFNLLPNVRTHREILADPPVLELPIEEVWVGLDYKYPVMIGYWGYTLHLELLVQTKREL